MAAFEIFLAGAITFAYAVAGLFFLHFWTRTRNRMFVALALAFWILAAAQVPLISFGITGEAHYVHYVLRLVAFCVIILAIIDKNVRFDSH